MKKSYIRYIVIIWYLIFFGKKIFTKKVECIKTHEFQKFMDSDFRKKIGVVSFDTLGSESFKGNDYVFFKFKSASYPFLETIEYVCKYKLESDYIRLSKDSSLRIDYTLDSLNIQFNMVHSYEVLTPLEAYKILMNSDIINQESKLFYGYNRDSLEQLVIHQSKKKDSVTSIRRQL